MFKLVSTYDGAGTIYDTFKVTAEEAIADGETLKFGSGRVTKASAADVVRAVAVQAVAASASGVYPDGDCILVREDQVWEAPYTTANTGVPAPGGAYRIASDGLSVDADNANGKFLVISVDTTAATCKGRFLQA
jgi:hypothetical protein